jgi:1-phosphofructokinase
MVAALSYSIDLNLPMEECIKMGVATSAGTVTTIGTKPPTKELVETLKQQVKLIKL